MRLIGLLLIALFFASCGNDLEETHVQEENYTVPAPSNIVVREDAYGRAEYVFVDDEQSADDAYNRITRRPNSQNWKSLDGQQKINRGTGYPRSPYNGAVSFVTEASDFTPPRRQRNPNGISDAYRSCYGPNHGYHMYYGYSYNNYQHCYPSNYSSYSNYRYHPTVYWRNTYYYYQPYNTYYNYNTGWRYYFYYWWR